MTEVSAAQTNKKRHGRVAVPYGPKDHSHPQERLSAAEEQLHLLLDKPARGRYTMDNRIEQPSSGGRMLPAEIGRQTP